MTRALPLVAAAAALAACNVSPVAEATPGVPLADAGACPRAFVVTDSDYASTNVSIVSSAGDVLSASILSSGSASAGLTTALSGDVVPPLGRPASGRMVLIDRYPNAVLTWVDPGSAAVLHQTSVATGFSSNPHDYLEVDAAKAYVTRYETNPAPGRQPFDEGGDVLVLDAASFAIAGRVSLALPGDGPLLPRADRMIRVGDRVWVSLQRFDATFARAGDARIVGIDVATDRVAFALDLPGVASCGDLAIAPSGALVATACSGVLGSGAALSTRSALVLIDATKDPPVEVRRIEAAAALGAPLGSGVAFASEDTLVGVALGDTEGDRSDAVYRVDLATGAVTRVAEAGGAFVLGDVRCTPGCGDVCLVADARANALRRWSAGAAGLSPLPDVAVDPAVGLPPRGLGPL